MQGEDAGGVGRAFGTGEQDGEVGEVVGGIAARGPEVVRRETGVVQGGVVGGEAAEGFGRLGW